MKKILLSLIIGLLIVPLFYASADCPSYSLEDIMKNPSGTTFTCQSDYVRIDWPMYLRLVALEKRVDELEAQNKILSAQQSYQYDRISVVEASVKTFAIQIIQVLTLFNSFKPF